GGQGAVHVLVERRLHVGADHRFKASRNSRRARNSCALDVPTAMPVSPAISSWRYPSTSCSTNTSRAPGGSAATACSRSSPISGPPPAPGSLERRRVVGRHDALLPPPLGTPSEEHLVHGEPVEPRGECALAPERGEPLPRPNERVLRPLLGLHRIRREPQAQRIHPTHVRV